MKRSIACLAAFLLSASSAASAGESISDVANWTPSMYANVVSPQGWKELSDTDQYRLWTTFVQVKKPQFGIVVSVKTAEKGVDGSITNISIVSVNAVCGVNGAPPNYVQMGMSESFDEHGPIAGDAGGPTVRLVPDTNLAVAVQHACKNANTDIDQSPMLPASDHCSVPTAVYPPLAVRKNQQGVATISADVRIDKHLDHLSVKSSTGSDSLDNAALDAVSKAVCNDSPGTRINIPITFSLGTSR